MLLSVPLNWRSLQRFESWTASGPATITNVETTLMTFASVTLEIFQRVRVTWWVRATKGATLGDVELVVKNNGGTAILNFSGNVNPPRSKLNAVPANAVWTLAGETEFFCSQPGTLILHIAASSQGSNSSVALNDATIRYQILFG